MLHGSKLTCKIQDDAVGETHADMPGEGKEPAQHWDRRPHNAERERAQVWRHCSVCRQPQLSSKLPSSSAHTPCGTKARLKVRGRLDAFILRELLRPGAHFVWACKQAGKQSVSQQAGQYASEQAQRVLLLTFGA